MQNNETGDWLDLPMDARLVIPEKTFVKVFLSTQDSGVSFGVYPPVKQITGARLVLELVNSKYTEYE